MGILYWCILGFMFYQLLNNNIDTQVKMSDYSMRIMSLISEIERDRLTDDKDDKDKKLTKAEEKEIIEKLKETVSIILTTVAFFIILGPLSWTVMFANGKK